MAKVKVKDRTLLFLNKYDYNKLGSLRRAIQSLLKLENDAQLFGSEGSMIILADIKSGLDQYSSPSKVLTDNQREAIYLCLVEDKTESEAAEILDISPQAVNARVNSGVKRIREYLLTGEMSTGVFTEDETKLFIFYYNEGRKPLEIAHILKKPPRQVRNKIKSLQSRGAIGLRIKSKID